MNTATASYDLCVAYRIYPKVSKIPPVYGDDKLQLSELCLRSFCTAFGQLKVKVIAILDTCPSSYRDLFERVIPINDLEIIEVTNEGNANTFRHQISLLLEQKHSEMIYLAEDDYFYLPNSLEQMVGLIRSSSDADFVTPYDHLDYYTSPTNKHPTIIQIASGRHWRLAATTCLTFLTTKQTLLTTRNVFATFHEKGNLDFAVWLALTKFHVRNPNSVFRFLNLWRRGVKMPWWSVKHAWVHSRKEILLGRKYKLWAPIPSCATHMESNFLAPNINWTNHFSRYL